MTNNTEVSPATLELKVGSVIYGWNAEPISITGETKVSWLIGDRPWDQTKVSKKAMRETGNDGTDIYSIRHWVSKEEAELHYFVRNNRYRIARAVEYCNDYALVKAIADLIGYKEAVHEPK